MDVIFCVYTKKFQNPVTLKEETFKDRDFLNNTVFDPFRECLCM